MANSAISRYAFTKHEFIEDKPNDLAQCRLAVLSLKNGARLMHIQCTSHTKHTFTILVASDPRITFNLCTLSALHNKQNLFKHDSRPEFTIHGRNLLFTQKSLFIAKSLFTRKHYSFAKITISSKFTFSFSKITIHCENHYSLEKYYSRKFIFQEKGRNNPFNIQILFSKPSSRPEFTIYGRKLLFTRKHYSFSKKSLFTQISICTSKNHVLNELRYSSQNFTFHNHFACTCNFFTLKHLTFYIKQFNQIARQCYFIYK